MRKADHDTNKRLEDWSLHMLSDLAQSGYNLVQWLVNEC